MHCQKRFFHILLYTFLNSLIFCFILRKGLTHARGKRERISMWNIIKHKVKSRLPLADLLHLVLHPVLCREGGDAAIAGVSVDLSRPRPPPGPRHHLRLHCFICASPGQRDTKERLPDATGTPCQVVITSAADRWSRAGRDVSPPTIGRHRV